MVLAPVSPAPGVGENRKTEGLLVFGRKHGGRLWPERVDGIILSGQKFLPLRADLDDLLHVQLLMQRRVAEQITPRQLEERGGGPEPVFLQVDERAGELNQLFAAVSRKDRKDF